MSNSEYDNGYSDGYDQGVEDEGGQAIIELLECKLIVKRLCNVIRNLEKLSSHELYLIELDLDA